MMPHPGASPPVPAAGTPPTASAPPAPVDNTPPPPPGTVPDLAANCSIGLAAYEKGSPDMHIGQCSGFIDAVMQDLEERAETKGNMFGICLTNNVNELDTVKLFILWAHRHPEPIQALDGLRTALKEAYPCAK